MSLFKPIPHYILDHLECEIMLSGILGSHAYGLAVKESDIDVQGVYLHSLKKIASLGYNVDRQTVTHTKPDYTYHELAKTLKLCCKGNPTVLELLFIPEHMICTDIGQELINLRYEFLTKNVCHSYLGFATSQIRLLHIKTYENSRKMKTVRHLFRLLYQLEEILQTHNLTVELNKAQKSFVYEISYEIINNSHDVLELAKHMIEDIVKIPNTLPEHVNTEKINDFLWQVRLNLYQNNEEQA